MNKREVAIDVVREVFELGGPAACIKVRPSLDIPGNVLVCTSTVQDKEEYGNIGIDLSASLMRQLATAILQCADEVERAEAMERT